MFFTLLTGKEDELSEYCVTLETEKQIYMVRRNYSINKNRTEKWKADVQKSVMFYNEWFLNFAPKAYVNARKEAIDKVENMFHDIECFNSLSVDILKNNPDAITILRLSTTPPLSRDRLIGLSGVSANLIDKMEEGRFPPRMSQEEIDESLERIIEIIHSLLDYDMMPWLKQKSYPHETDRNLAIQVIGDRVCGSLSDPIIRNEQERRQLNSIGEYLNRKGYRFVESNAIEDFQNMECGMYSFHLNVLAERRDGKSVNMPIDVVIKRKNAIAGELPVLIECKSAGDFTNTNKRRKEEAIKIEQLQLKYGQKIELVLFLCGYFDSGYLGYEAGEGIDWIWEHRIEDFKKLGI